MILRKKCISILLLTVLTASLCACGNTSKSISDSKIKVLIQVLIIKIMRL